MSNSSDSGFDWLDQRWFVGTPTERCRYCGLPEIFVPDCLGIDVCKCNRVLENASTVKVRFHHTKSFSVRIHVRRITTQYFGKSSPSIFSGRIPFARDGNPCRRVLEASSRVHGSGHRAAMHRPTHFQTSKNKNFVNVQHPAFTTAAQKG